ncbi:Ldh family oxidoreductase [Agarivorans albus]|uniref:Malate dehydrogenase n=1 Tax=Agarivorans albus MKT 106 TaxID=1331007 RepID=R9PRD1_AGAAL|nr:Ldh family oxidoreductase [Agarivorans albus]GAD03909.1 malate dehydrogenase [Agarivorans albus MKT 106]
MSTQVQTKKVDAGFIEFSLKRVWQATGASEEHANAVSRALMTGIRQGKLNQGLGVYEAIDLTFQAGELDIKAEPEVVGEGDAWAVVDGKRSSGYWTVTKMAELAIAKAKKHGIAIVFGGNHNDAGSYGSYAWMAHEQNMFAQTSNNSVPMASPYGGMANVLSVPPFDAIAPSGNEAPVWTSVKLCEWYDADTAQSVLQGTKVKKDSVIDPQTGELGNDLAPFARPVEGYGRVFDQSCYQNLTDPRLYSLNLWNEALSAIINPLGVIAPEMPTLTDYLSGDADKPSVGGSYYIAIDPSHFGPIGEVLAKADRFTQAVQQAKPLPGKGAPRMPGQKGYYSLKAQTEEVEVLASHWAPFFEKTAAKYGLNEAKLREEYALLTQQEVMA